jgi:hypothetical protein
MENLRGREGVDLLCGDEQSLIEQRKSLTLALEGGALHPHLAMVSVGYSLKFDGCNQ